MKEVQETESVIRLWELDFYLFINRMSYTAIQISFAKELIKERINNLFEEDLIVIKFLDL